MRSLACERVAQRELRTAVNLVSSRECVPAFGRWDKQNEPPKGFEGSVNDLAFLGRLLRCVGLGVLFWCELAALDVARV